MFSCPKCNELGASTHRMANLPELNDEDFIYVRCGFCGFVVGNSTYDMGMTKEKAIKLWNDVSVAIRLLNIMKENNVRELLE